MTRLEKRDAVLQLPGGLSDHGILEVCPGIRMSVNGSADPMDKETLAILCEYLFVCLETWEDTMITASEDYDDAIKRMIVATLGEVHYYESGTIDKLRLMQWRAKVMPEKYS